MKVFSIEIRRFDRKKGRSATANEYNTTIIKSECAWGLERGERSNARARQREREEKIDARGISKFREKL